MTSPPGRRNGGVMRFDNSTLDAPLPWRTQVPLPPPGMIVRNGAKHGWRRHRQGPRRRDLGMTLRLSRLSTPGLPRQPPGPSRGRHASQKSRRVWREREREREEKLGIELRSIPTRQPGRRAHGHHTVVAAQELERRGSSSSPDWFVRVLGSRQARGGSTRTPFTIRIRRCRCQCR